MLQREGLHMDDKSKQSLSGSPSRDCFKYLHKNRVRKTHYATDLDFVLVHKATWDSAVIPAVIDYKKFGPDKVTFTEAVVYKFFVDSKIPVYIVKAEYDSILDDIVGPFEVKEIIQVKWRAPIITYSDVTLMLKDWDEFDSWETKIRLWAVKNGNKIPP